MRTVIFIGLLAIATAIRQNIFDKSTTEFFAAVLIAAMFMDVIDFLDRRKGR